MDAGDGSTFFWTETGGPTIAVTVVKTVVDGTAISPGGTSYFPTGSNQYTFTQDTAEYGLWGKSPATDGSGTALTALPAIGSTICDPDDSAVLQAISPPPAAGTNNYNVFDTASCAAADITAALAGGPVDTALVSTQATGNAYVPSVLLITGLTNYTWANNYIIGLRAGNAWFGYTAPAGFSWTEANKTANNADLTDAGNTAAP